MKRTERQIEIAGLNIAMHRPHSPQRYAALFHEAHALRTVVPLGEALAGMLGMVHLADRDDPEAGLSGEFYRFMNIDPTEPWFSTQTGNPATERDMEEVSIPDHLSPNMKRVPFFFDTRAHKLYFIARDRKVSISPKVVQRLVEGLVRPLMEQSRFPQIEVTVLPDQDTVAAILSMPRLERLEVMVLRPNPDHGLSEEQRIEERMEKMQARQIKTEVVAVSGASIEPDAFLLDQIHTAADNGYVRATGRDAEGKRIVDSTKSEPRRWREVLNENVQTVYDVLRNVAGRRGGS